MLAAPFASATDGHGLPPEECVRLLRAARIARMSNDASEELARIQEARQAFPDELTPTFALLDYQRRNGRSEELNAELRADLVGRLRDRAYELPIAVISHLVSDPDLDADAQELLADQLSVRAEGATEPAAMEDSQAGPSPEATRDLAAAEPPDPQLLVLLAVLQQRLGRIEEAAATRLRLWEQTGSQAQLWPLISDLQTLGRWSEAADHLRTLLEGGAVGVRSALLNALVRSGRFDDLLAEVERGESQEVPESTLDPTSWLDELKLLAWQSRDQGRDDVAEALFRRVVAHNGADNEARAALLYLYGSAEEQASHAEAIALRWRTESDPQALLNEGAQLLSTGDAQGAFDLLDRAAPFLPQVEAAWYNLGMAAYRLEKWQKVDEGFAKAAELNPDRAQSHYFRGIALVQLSRCRDAIQPLLRALELDATRTQAHYYLAGCYRELGNEGEANRHRDLYGKS